MRHIIKSALRPISNRNYTSRKVSALMYAANLTLPVLICLLCAITISSLFWLALMGFIIFGFIDYTLFDSTLDRFSWNFIWRRFYSNEDQSNNLEHAMLKDYESNPSADNYQKLKEHLKKNS